MKEFAQRVEKAVIEIRGTDRCYDAIPKEKQTNIDEVCNRLNVPKMFVLSVLGRR